jgi:glycosyltransferase involved in cell wall biosynthesis
VTINGKWQDQPAHCLSFENPCLDDHNLDEGREAVRLKGLTPPYTICFSGRLESAKGVNRILEALAKMTDKSVIKVVHFIGDGSERSYFEDRAKLISIQCLFHGFLQREQVFKILKESDFFVFPSLSEGFPKVVAEAANFGCIPVVSNVSSIPQYINEANGFVWDVSKDFNTFFQQVFLNSVENLKERAEQSNNLAPLFTYTRYVERLKYEILKF